MAVKPFKWRQMALKPFEKQLKFLKSSRTRIKQKTSIAPFVTLLAFAEKCGFNNDSRKVFSIFPFCFLVSQFCVLWECFKMIVVGQVWEDVGRVDAVFSWWKCFVLARAFKVTFVCKWKVFSLFTHMRFCVPERACTFQISARVFQRLWSLLRTQSHTQVL